MKSKFVLALVVTSLLSVPALAALEPKADAYAIDPVHSHIGFAVKHLGVSTMRGNFKNFSGTINLDPTDIIKSSVEITIQVESIDTDNAKRDTSLKGPNFFDVAKYPDITFKSTKIQKRGKGYECIGQFTMHGVTNTVTLPFILSGPIQDQEKRSLIGVESKLTINRQNYGISWNRAMDSGVSVISDTVEIILNIEAVKK